MNSLEKSWESDIDVDRAKWETKVFGALALIALIAFLLREQGNSRTPSRIAIILWVFYQVVGAD